MMPFWPFMCSFKWGIAFFGLDCCLLSLFMDCFVQCDNTGLMIVCFVLFVLFLFV